MISFIQSYWFLFWFSTVVFLAYFDFELPLWHGSKESACQCRIPRFNPWVGKNPWRRKWQPIPVFVAEILYPMDREAHVPQSMELERVGHYWATKQQNNSDLHNPYRMKMLLKTISFTFKSKPQVTHGNMHLRELFYSHSLCLSPCIWGPCDILVFFFFPPLPAICAKEGKFGTGLPSYVFY